MTNVQRQRKSKRAEKRFNRNFLIVCAVIAAFTFGRIIYREQKFKTDYSIDLNNVDAAILVKPHSYASGPEHARITIVQFLDPQCHTCFSMHWTIKRVVSEFPKDIRVLIRYFPFRDEGRVAAALAEEAREIEKFDETLDEILSRQKEWGDGKYTSPALLPGFIAHIGLSSERFLDDKLLAKHKWKIDLDVADARQIGITKAPAVFVNGRMISLSYEALRAAVVGGLE